LDEPRRLGRFSGSANPGGASAGSWAGGFGVDGVLGGVVAIETRLSSQAESPKHHFGRQQEAGDPEQPAIRDSCSRFRSRKRVPDARYQSTGLVLI
jgi:hypothetical protein